MTRSWAIPRTRWPAVGLRLVLGGVFIYAGVSKLAAPQAFADGIAAYRMAPEVLVNVLAMSLPPLEITLGFWLNCGWRQRSAAFCATGLLVVFLTAIVSARLRGLQVDCACFGPAEAPASPTNTFMALARDVALTAAALVLYVIAWRESRATERLDFG